MAPDNYQPTLSTLLDRLLEPDMQFLCRQVLEFELRGRLPRWFPRWLVPIVVGALLAGGQRSALHIALERVVLKLWAEMPPHLQSERRIPEPPVSPRPQ